MLRITKSRVTLVGLLIAAAFAVTLVSMELSLYTSGTVPRREAALRADLELMNVAIDSYHAERHRYPSSLAALVRERYLRAIPRDPFTNSTDTWQVELSDAALGRGGAEAGVVKVRSGSDRLALDGTRYRDW